MLRAAANKYLLLASAIALIVITVISLFPAVQVQEQTAEQTGGRKYIYTAVIKLKSPDNPDDPWYTGADGGVAKAHDMLAYHGSSAASGSGILTTALGSISPPTTWNAYTNYTIASDIDQIQSMTLRITFSFSSTVTAKLYIIDSEDIYRHSGFMYTGVANTFQAGTSYRWTIIFPRYNDTNISVFPFTLHGNNLQYYRVFPWTVVCRYVDQNLNIAETASGLTLSVTNSIVNTTHIQQYITITFDSTWNGLTVTQCKIYTTDATILNFVNQRANRAVSQLIIAQVNLPSIVVSTGDQVVLNVYAVAPTSVSVS